MNSSKKPHVPRPLWLKLLAFGLFILSLLGWMRFFESVTSWQTLIESGMTPGPLYTAASGFLLGGVALTAAIGVWLRLPWAPAFTRWMIGLWLVWMWSDRLYIASSPNALANWPFLAGISLILLAGVFYFLHRGRNRFQ